MTRRESAMLIKASIVDPVNNVLISSHTIPQGTIFTIGRSTKSTIIIPGEYHYISGIHCMVQLQNDKIKIFDGSQDRPSTNGTYISNSRILPSCWVEINLTSSVMLGKPGQNLAINFQVVKEVNHNYAIIEGLDQRDVQVSAKNSGEVIAETLIATRYQSLWGINNQTGHIILSNQRILFCARNKVFSALVTGPLLDMMIKSDKIRWEEQLHNISEISVTKRMGLLKIFEIKPRIQDRDSLKFALMPNSNKVFEDWCIKSNLVIVKSN